MLYTSGGFKSRLRQVFLFTVVLVSVYFLRELVTIHLRNGFVDQIHELNMFSVLDKVRDNKDDWRKQIERMKRGRHHLTEEAKLDYFFFICVYLFQPVLHHPGIPRDIYRFCTIGPIYQFTFKVFNSVFGRYVLECFRV
jgi:hypothetical protein